MRPSQKTCADTTNTYTCTLPALQSQVLQAIGPGLNGVFIYLAVRKIMWFDVLKRGRPSPRGSTVHDEPNGQHIEVTTHPLAAILEVLSSLATVAESSHCCLQRCGGLYRHNWYWFSVWLLAVIVSQLMLCLHYVSLSDTLTIEIWQQIITAVLSKYLFSTPASMDISLGLH